MKYRGIENWYGNGWQWVDGINININATGDVYVSNTTADFADNTDTNYTLIASDYETSGSGYITDWSNIDDYFIASANTGGSSSTYVTDHNNTSANVNRIVAVGGDANDGTLAGAFEFLCNLYDGSRFLVVSARLAR